MAASVAKIALPVQNSLGASAQCGDFSLNTQEVGDFLAGFIHGFTGHDNKDYFRTCFTDNDAFENDVCTMVNDFRTKDNQKVIEGVKKVLADMPEIKGFLDGCPNAAADVKVVGDWFTYWKNAGEMKVYSTAYKNVVGNMDTIKKDADVMEDDYDAQDYYGTADMAASVAKIALPVQSSLGASAQCGDFSLNTQEVGDFLAGFIHGFTGHDNKDYFRTCFADNDAFENDVCTMVNDFRTKDNQKVIEGVKKVLADMPEIKGFLDGCPNAAADVKVVGDWFTYWKDAGEMKVYSTAYKNVVGNMDTIKKDADVMEKDYDAQK